MKIVIVGCEAGDWETLYIDGQNVCESHKIRTSDVLDELQKRGVLTHEKREVTDDWQEMNCHCTTTLDDIPEDAYTDYEEGE